MVWGLYFAVLLVIEKLWLLKRLEKSRVFSRIYTMLLVVVGFVIFNAADMQEAFRQIGGMFGAGGIALYSAESLYYLRSYALLLIIGILGATPAAKNCLGKLEPLRPILAPALLLICTAYLVDGSFNPFLYFRF